MSHCAMSVGEVTNHQRQNAHPLGLHSVRHECPKCQRTEIDRSGQGSPDHDPRLVPVTDGNRTYFEWTSEFDSDPDSEARLVPLMEQNFLAGARELRAQFAVGR